MDFRPLYKGYSSPKWGSISVHSIIRTQFRIETFLIAGALLQCVLSAVLPLRYALVPACSLAVFKLGDMYATRYGFKSNPHMMDGNVQTKFSAQFPARDGTFGNQPARDGLAVFLIGARNNTAVGMLDKRFGKIGEFMQDMQDELRANADELGFLGGSLWSGTERSSNPTIMNVMYFRSAAHVHEYAHSELHKKAWSYWYENIQNVSELSIFHELYEVPAGNYEAIYDNMPPMLLAETQHLTRRKTDNGAQDVWMSPVVDARKGQLKTSKGRMARSQGQENNKYGYNDEDSYQEIAEQSIV